MDKAAEIEARLDLTAALRWAARLGLGEGICNHFSLELPGRSGLFLINPQGLHWSEVTPADLVVVDAHGSKIEGRHSVEPTAFFIHGAAHRGNPMAKCVLHTHMPYTTALTVVQGGRLEWASQTSLKFRGRVAYDDDYNGLALDEAEGERLCASLADAEILFLANHGVIVTGSTLQEATYRAASIDRVCRMAYDVMLLGKDPLSMPAGAVKGMKQSLLERAVDVYWAGAVRQLVRTQPEVLT